jgi:hemerythrin-like domain-containing protein
MKRHPAFIPLSHDHHRTLILAQSIKKGAPPFRGMAVTDEGKRKEMILHYEEHLKDHFRKEEKIFAECNGISPETAQLITGIVGEHRNIESLIHDLSEWNPSEPESNSRKKDGKEIVDTLDALGFLLEKHIRKEERELFPMLQEKLDEATLQKITEVLLH